MTSFRSLLLPAVSTFAATVLSGQAAVTAVTAATYNGNANQVRTLTSVTIGGTVYDQLQGATSATLGRDTADMRYWVSTDPGSNTAAVTGLTVSSGILNTLATFQFGRTLTGTDVLFFFDLESDDVGDAMEVRLVNASGADVGSANLSILGTSFGNRLYQTPYSSNSGIPALSNGSYGPMGVAFSVADFSGDVSTATGFRIIQSGTVTMDPMVAGIAAVPEPSAALLTAGAAALGLIRRRRK